MKKGLTLEEAIKALNGRLSVNEGSKKAVKGKRKVRESVEETYFKDIKKLEQMYDCTFSISDNVIEGYRGHTTLFFKEFKNEEELKDIIKKLLDEEVEYDDGEEFDEDSFELYEEKTDSKNVRENKKNIKEEFNDFPKLTDLAKGEVFTAYFGNHESCDFSYDSTKDTLIQKYYDPADTFKYKNIKTQTDFEKAVKDDLGDGKITWEKKDSRKPAHLKEDVFEKDNLRKYTAAVREIKNDPTKKIVLDYGELQDPRFLSITFENGKLVIDDEEEKYDLDPEVMKDWMNFDSIKVF